MSHEVPSDRPPPPPGLVSAIPPSGSASVPAGTAPAATEPVPTGYAKTYRIAVKRHDVAWLPAILLTITFLCTFFPWVGTYLGSTPVDTQGLWRAISGYPSRDIAVEKAMDIKSEWLDRVTSDWLLMVPYLLVLVAAVALAWLERALQKTDIRRITPLAIIWPRRTELIIVLAAIAFFILLIQSSYGFGLERAMRSAVNEQFQKERDSAAGSPSNLATVKFNEELEYRKFNLGYTFWFYLGITCNLLAVFAALCVIGLEKRGSKPPPRIVIQY